MKVTVVSEGVVSPILSHFRVFSTNNLKKRSIFLPNVWRYVLSRCGGHKLTMHDISFVLSAQGNKMMLKSNFCIILLVAKHQSLCSTLYMVAFSIWWNVLLCLSIHASGKFDGCDHYEMGVGVMPKWKTAKLGPPPPDINWGGAGGGAGATVTIMD